MRHTLAALGAACLSALFFMGPAKADTPCCFIMNQSTIPNVQSADTVGLSSIGSVLYMVYQNAGAFYVTASTDNGKTWSQPVNTSLSSNWQYGASMALYKGDLYIVFSVGAPEAFLSMSQVTLNTSGIPTGVTGTTQLRANLATTSTPVLVASSQGLFLEWDYGTRVNFAQISVDQPK